MGNDYKRYIYSPKEKSEVMVETFSVPGNVERHRATRLGWKRSGLTLNSLPQSVVSAGSMDYFKRLMDVHLSENNIWEYGKKNYTHTHTYTG